MKKSIKKFFENLPAIRNLDSVLDIAILGGSPPVQTAQITDFPTRKPR